MESLDCLLSMATEQGMIVEEEENQEENVREESEEESQEIEEHLPEPPDSQVSLYSIPVWRV